MTKKLTTNLTAYMHPHSRFHYLVVVVPHVLWFKDHAVIYITGGSNTDAFPSSNSRDIEMCAVVADVDHVICAVLYMVPNQPIVFPDDPSHEVRTEDAIIAWTWYHYLTINSSEPFWILQLPMVKAAVRAMDTVTDYVHNTYGYNIDKFVVSGASKRGWAAWLTAAVDPRVVSVIPIVMGLSAYCTYFVVDFVYLPTNAIF